MPTGIVAEPGKAINFSWASMTGVAYQVTSSWMIDVGYRYPFSDGTLGAMKGDYTNLHVTADLDLRNLAGNLGVPTAPPTGGLPGVPGLPVPTPTLPTTPGLPLPGQPSPTSTSTGGTVCVPGLPCVGSGPSQRLSSDSSWRSLYTGGQA